MRASCICLLVVGLIGTTRVGAQEISAFGVAGTGKEMTLGSHYGAGVAIAGFVPARRLFGGDSSAYSGAHIGLRGAFSVLSARTTEPVFAPCPPSGCNLAALTRSRITATQLALIIRPHHGSSTRFDVGAGTSFYALQGGGIEWGLLATAGISRRIAGSAWLSLGYDLHGQIEGTYVADGANTEYATHLLRAGISIAR